MIFTFSLKLKYTVENVIVVQQFGAKCVLKVFFKLYPKMKISK